MHNIDHLDDHPTPADWQGLVDGGEWPCRTQVIGGKYVTTPLFGEDLDLYYEHMRDLEDEDAR